MTLKELKTLDTLNYFEWRESGSHEASDKLNDGNRQVISEYMKLYPNAMGYKFHVGFVDLRQEKHCNFFCDYVFNGTDENITYIKQKEKVYNETLDPEVLAEALEQADGICFIWS